MTLSAYIDARQLTSGGVAVAIYDTAIGTGYLELSNYAGSVGIVSGTWTVPSGVTEVRVLFDIANCSMNAGSQAIFSQPQLTNTSDLEPYNQGPTWTIYSDTGVEVVGNGYAPQPITFGPNDSTGTSTQTNNITFGPATADWPGGVAGWAVTDTSGNQYAFYEFPTPIPVPSGSTVQFTVADNPITVQYL